MTQAAGYGDLLDPQALVQIGNLELLSTRVVDGYLSGKHRSTQKGGCVEFAEHRAYTHGDEIRRLDWRVFARSDRYYIKQFQEETNLQVLVVLDASGSMGFGLSTPSKLDYARMAAACLARLMLRQRDEVGLAVLNGQTRRYIPPRSTPAHLQSILDALRGAKPAGESSLSAELLSAARRLKRRGMVMIFSDGIDDLDAFSKALNNLRLRGHEPLVFHTMAPEELSFAFSRWSRFQCLEAKGLRIDLDPVAVRKRYLRRVRTFLDELKKTCVEFGCDYVPMAGDRPLGDVLAYYLRKRAARLKKMK